MEITDKRRRQHRASLSLDQTNLQKKRRRKIFFLFSQVAAPFFFALESKRVDSSGKYKTRKQIAETWKSLTVEEKSQYGKSDEQINVPCVPGDHSGPPGDEDIPTDVDTPHVDQLFATLCTPSRLFRAVSGMLDEQKQAVDDIGFGSILRISSGRLRRGLCLWLVHNIDVDSRSLRVHGKTIPIDSCSFADIMGVPNGGLSIHLDGKHPGQSEWASTFSVSRRGICIKLLERRLHDMTSSGDEFKIAFCLFLMGTLLAPWNSDFVSADFISPLTNVAAIPFMDWSTWCLNFQYDGICNYKNCAKPLKKRSISSCLLFLQLLYLHSLEWHPSVVDKSLSPLQSWTNKKINICLRRMRRASGLDSVQDDIISLNNQVDGMGSWVRQAEENDIKGSNECDKGNKLNDDLGSPRTRVPNPKKQDVVAIGVSRPPVIQVASLTETGSLHEKNETELAAALNETDLVALLATPPWMKTLETVVPSTLLTGNAEDKNSTGPTVDEVKLNIGCVVGGYGPFELSFRLNMADDVIVRYIFDRDLPESEIILQLGGIRVSRHSILTLEPGRYLNNEVIDFVGLALEVENRRSLSSAGTATWFLPTYFAYVVLTAKTMTKNSLKRLTGSFKGTYMPNFVSCNKYMVAIKVMDNNVEILDSLASGMESAGDYRVMQVRKMLNALDIVLAEDIAGSIHRNYRFSGLHISVQSSTPKQTNLFDCGVYACKYMHQMGTHDCQFSHDFSKLNSQGRRVRLVQCIAGSPNNEIIQYLKGQANAYINDPDRFGVRIQGEKRAPKNEQNKIKNKKINVS
ncbi:hypothetical protein ACOSP7_026882 [Xanthoceras sorbifolium]